MDPVLSEAYERFARLEARGRSPLYDKMAQWVAGSEASQRFLLNLPQDRRQPNLLFAAMRMVHGLPESGEAFDDALYDAGDAIAHVMRTRTTQTNEPGRCATLMPLLDEIDGPIALIEVGASAGLCLLPDYYGYDWGHARLMPDKDKVSGTVPVFPCATSEATPLPETYPDIVWREGLDLNPLDVTNDDDTQWLELLVWPEHKARLASLRLAIDVARQHKPLVRQGDLRDDLVALIEEAPKDATLVVFHTAVLSYVTPEVDRRHLADLLLSRSDVIWLCNESPFILPQRLTGAGQPPRPGLFLMSRNGAPKAWTGPHGQSIDWIRR